MTQPTKRIAITERRYRSVFVSIDDVVNKYLEWCSWTFGASSMDFENAHIHGTNEPVMLPPNIEGVHDLEVVFDAVSRRMGEHHWILWIARRVRQATWKECAHAFNVRHKLRGDMRFNEHNVKTAVELVDADMIYELKQHRMWAELPDLTRQSSDIMETYQ